MPRKSQRKPDTTNQTRLIQLVNLIRQLQPVPFKELMERLEVSRATLRRDFDLLRDRLNMPVTFDRLAGGYVISKEPNRYGGTFELPGLWLTVNEGYALLTLFNVLEKIDPGLLHMYVQPLRGVIKKVLCSKDFDMMGLNLKIDIELGDFKNARMAIFSKLSQALLSDKKVSLRFTKKNYKDGTYLLGKLILTPTGWIVESAETEEHRTVRFPAIAVSEIEILG